MAHYKKSYIFSVKYVDGGGKSKAAVIKALTMDMDSSELLSAAMSSYGDHFAQEYTIEFIREEKKLSLFDK